MADPHKPTKMPHEVKPEQPETTAPQRELPEGGLPGLPVSHDPLSQPMPHPAEREIPPLD